MTVLVVAVWSVVAALVLARVLLVRVTVVGESMRRTLRAGTTVVALRARWCRPPRVGDVVVFKLPFPHPDPSFGDWYIVKRVGATAANWVYLIGDTDDSFDSREFGALDIACFVGRILDWNMKTRI